MPTILLVRHAQASFGSADYDLLSDLGRAQVGALVAGLDRRGIAPDRVASGSLRRQRDTADPCAAAAGLDVDVDERFDEYDDADVLTHHSTPLVRLQRHPGDTPTLSSREFQVVLNAGLRGWVAAGADSPCRQPWPRFQEHVTAALRDVADGLGKGETALVVSSSGVIAALSAALL